MRRQVFTVIEGLHRVDPPRITFFFGPDSGHISSRDLVIRALHFSVTTTSYHSNRKKLPNDLSNTMDTLSPCEYEWIDLVMFILPL